MKQPLYVIFAGVNGAGKSTFYQSDLWRSIVSDIPKTMERVNADEILRSFGGDQKSSTDQLKAGKLAVKQISQLFAEKRSFNQETTLCGRYIIRNIIKANELGYRIVLNYIGVNSPEIALDRIAHRVSVGGHDIAKEDVVRRFQESLGNMSRVIEFCEAAVIYDNTREFKTLAQWSKNTLCWWGNPKADGPWFLDVINNESIWAR